MAGRTTRPRGGLEAEVMDVLWESAEPLTAKQVGDLLSDPVPAPTTVLTIIDRLIGKGRIVKVLDRPRGSTYAAAQSEADHVSTTMLDALTSTDDRGAALLRFAGALEGNDLALLQKALRKADRGASKS